MRPVTAIALVTLVAMAVASYAPQDSHENMVLSGHVAEGYSRLMKLFDKVENLHPSDLAAYEVSPGRTWRETKATAQGGDNEEKDHPLRSPVRHLTTDITETTGEDTDIPNEHGFACDQSKVSEVITDLPADFICNWYFDTTNPEGAGSCCNVTELTFLSENLPRVFEGCTVSDDCWDHINLLACGLLCSPRKNDYQGQTCTGFCRAFSSACADVVCEDSSLTTNGGVEYVCESAITESCFNSSPHHVGGTAAVSVVLAAFLAVTVAW